MLDDEPSINEPLFRQVVESIRLDKERWSQIEYAQIAECGTVCCFAGWACLLSGYEFRFQTDHDRDRTSAMYLTNGDRIDTTAAHLLGLRFHDANQIFHFVDGGNDINGYVAHPTFNQLLDRITQVTGLEFKHDEPEEPVPF